MRCHRVLASVVSVAVAGAGIFGAATPAFAKPVLHVAYRVTGASTISSTGSSVTLGPSKLSVALNRDGSFTGSMPLPPATTSFRVAGLLPVSATVTFAQVGRITGRLYADPKPAVSAKSAYTIGLSDVAVAGVPTDVGTSCATAKPVEIDVATPKAKPFDVTKGGVLRGTYTIGPFAHCGLTTALINALVPGANNTVSLHLSNGRVAS